MRRRRLFLTLLTLALAGPAAILSLELATRVREARGAFVLQPEPSELGWLPRPDHGDHNRWGFRDEAWSVRPVPGWRRVVVLGDGATYGGEVRPDQTWVAQAELALRAAGQRIELLNMAVLGYDIVQVRALLTERALGFDPALVVYAWSPNDDLPSRAFELGDPPYPVALPDSPPPTAGLLATLAFLRPHSAWYRRAEGHALPAPGDPGDTPPDPAARAQRFELAWLALVRQLDRRGLPLVVMLLPDSATLAAVPQALERHARMRREALGHATVIDGLAALQPAGDDPSALLEGQHPSARAHALLGRAAAEALQALLRPQDDPVDTP